MNYVIYDHYDSDQSNPKEFKYDLLKLDQIISLNDIEYKVESITGNKVVMRMVRYKIGNTHNSFVHKCPAKKLAMAKLSSEEKKELEKTHTKTQIKSWEQGRVKMQGHMERMCPNCKVVFWKESMIFPEKVLVDKEYKIDG